jgi:hypothetical protein
MFNPLLLGHLLFQFFIKCVHAAGFHVVPLTRFEIYIINGLKDWAVRPLSRFEIYIIKGLKGTT